MTKQLTLQDYLGIARRRKWLLIIPPLVCAVAAFTISSFLKAKFTSTTLVLVEGQKVATNLVQPAVTEDLNERLLTMKEQILSRSRLEPVMQRFELYKQEQKNRPMEDLIDQMRANIAVEVIRGAKEGSTTGFYISFTADNPKLAQDVCAEITSLFMEENLKRREERAVGTTDFLASQLDESKGKLDEQDTKLAAFERKYLGQLPGEQSVNMNMLNNLRAQLDSVTETLSRAQQDKLYSESLLAQETTSVEAAERTPGAVTTTQMEEQLKRLQQELVGLEARYTPQHPDVIKTKQMIASLEQSMQQQGAIEGKMNAAAIPTARSSAVSSPSIQRLRDNIHVLETTITEKSSEQVNLQRAIKEYESRLELTPAVEEQYKQLTRDYQTAQNMYDDLLRKKSESEMSTDLERRQEGEQFRVVDPANLPEKPSFPNRMLLSAEGGGFGICLGAVLALFIELFKKVVRGESDIEFYLKIPVLATIPILDREPESSRRRWLRGTPGTNVMRGAEVDGC